MLKPQAGGPADPVQPAPLDQTAPESAATAESSTRQLVERLVSTYVRPHIWRLAAALLCMSGVAAATAGFTQLIKPIINEIFVARNADMLAPIAIASLATFVLKGVAGYGEAVLMSHAGFRIVSDIQSDLFKRLMRADLAFYQGTAPGQLVSRFINDINLLRTAVSNTMTGIGRDSLTALALVAVMFYEDWTLAVIAFLAFPTAVMPVVWIGQRMRRVSKSMQQEVGKLSVHLDEVFQGARHVKAYGTEARETQRADRLIDEVFRLNMRGAHTRNMLHPIMEALGGVAITAVVLYGGQQVIFEGKDPGSFFAFITALLLAFEPVKRLARLNANLQEGLAAAQRVFDLIDLEPAIRDRPGAGTLQVPEGEIRFEGVSFAYRPGAPALAGIHLAVEPGTKAALVGASGAGKSTLLNLIPRFYDVTAGRIAIDGTDIRDVTLESLRRRIALVSQDTLLFDQSVRANIAYGRPEASQEEIEAAARAAQAHGFIVELGDGYDTPVGPRGERLSGGQRQRIAIARALLWDAPILLLDEATSALDTESERQVQAALRALMRGRTVVVIAHRLSTIVDADRIYVLEGGRIIEQGSHEALLAQEGAYARLHLLQFAEGAASMPAEATPAIGATAG